MTEIKNKSLVQRAVDSLKQMFIVQRPKQTGPLHPARTLNCLIAYNQYGGYCIPRESMDRPAVQKIIRGEVYEPDTIAFISAHAGSGDIVHAGTFFGDFLPALSASLGAGNKIWAFEPNPESYKCAAITMQINSLRNVELFNAGLGHDQQVADLLIRTAEGSPLGGGSKIDDDQMPGEHVEVNLIAIDEAVPSTRTVSIIQLDVEGYEQKALTGALHTIERCQPIIILEDNNKIISGSWFKENILALGYEVGQQVHNNTVIMPMT